MKCHKIEKLLYLYRENELNATERQQLEEHLQACPDCRKTKAELQAMNQALVPVRSAALPTRVNEAVLRRINPQNHPPALLEHIVDCLARAQVRSALAFALIVLLSTLAWDRYDTDLRQIQLHQFMQTSSAGQEQDHLAGCREKVQRWYAGLRNSKDHFSQRWTYSTPVRLNPQQRHELTRMLQDCGLSDQRIQHIFNEYRI